MISTYNPGQNFRDTFTFLHQNSTIRSPPPPLNNVGCPGLKYVSKILFSLSTSTLFFFLGGGRGGNKFLIFFSDLTLSAIFLFHKKLLQKCQLSLNQLARIVVWFVSFFVPDVNYPNLNKGKYKSNQVEIILTSIHFNLQHVYQHQAGWITLHTKWWNSLPDTCLQQPLDASGSV